MSKQKLWELIEAYRTSGGREEHHFRKAELDTALNEALAAQPAQQWDPRECGWPACNEPTVAM